MTAIDETPPPVERAFRRGGGNLIALTCIQLGNALLPLVVYPLLLSVVGHERFSRIAITESVTLIVLAVVIYSFDVDGVSRIASLRVQADTRQMSAVFSEVLAARIGILGVGVLVLLAASPLLGADTVWLLLAWMLVPLGYILQATWFYQAIDQNAWPAAVIVVTRLTCLFLVHRLIVDPADYHLAPLLIGATYTAGGAVLLACAVGKFSVRIVPVPPARIREMIVHGRAVFVGNISVSLYRDVNVLVLGAFAGTAAVSTYAIAEKVVKVFQAGVRPLNQFFFPRVVRGLEPIAKPGPEAFRLVLRYTLPQLGTLAGAAIAALIIFRWFRELVPATFSFPHGADVGRLVAIMIVAVFFGVANYMFGVCGLNYLGRRRYLAMSILGTGAVSVLVCVVLVTMFSATGAAVTFALAEMMLFALIARAYA